MIKHLDSDDTHLGLDDEFEGGQVQMINIEVFIVNSVIQVKLHGLNGIILYALNGKLHGLEKNYDLDKNFLV